MGTCFKMSKKNTYSSPSVVQVSGSPKNWFEMLFTAVTENILSQKWMYISFIQMNLGSWGYWRLGLCRMSCRIHFMFIFFMSQIPFVTTWLRRSLQDRSLLKGKHFKVYFLNQNSPNQNECKRNQTNTLLLSSKWGREGHPPSFHQV